MAEFFAMGGFAVFVWPAYALSALGLGGMAVWAAAELRAARRREKSVPRRGGKP